MDIRPEAIPGDGEIPHPSNEVHGIEREGFLRWTLTHQGKADGALKKFQSPPGGHITELPTVQYGVEYMQGTKDQCCSSLLLDSCSALLAP